MAHPKLVDKYCWFSWCQDLFVMLVNVKLTPFGEGDTDVEDDRATWQLTPFPKIISIMVPKNSAIGSRIYSLWGFSTDWQSYEQYLLPDLAPSVWLMSVMWEIRYFGKWVEGRMWLYQGWSLRLDLPDVFFKIGHDDVSQVWNAEQENTKDNCPL